MATFLSLCQDAGTESGLISYQNKPQTVVGALGKWAEIVAFTRQAWSDIQRARQDWEFLRGEFSHALTIGKMDYAPAELGIATRFARFAIDLPVDGFRPMRVVETSEDDSQDLYQISPEVWSQAYGRGSQQPNRPSEYALRGGKLYVGPKPNKVYTLNGFYWKAPQVLSLDGDVPDFPEHFHDLIKWRAEMKVAGKDGAFTDRTVAQAEYSAMYRQLVNEQTRPVNMGAALA